MKKLLIIRHAKSDWGNPDTADFDRPLNARGKKNTHEMARRLLKKGIVPQFILSSPALRAISTAADFADTWGIKKKAIGIEKHIYEASVSRLISIINNLDNQYDFVAIFGHNPGLTELLIALCECDIYNIPTCGTALVEFPFDDWQMLSKGAGDLKLYDYPKNPEAV